MVEVFLKYSCTFFAICCLLTLPLIFTSPLLKLLGETSYLAAFTGVLSLLLGLLGYLVFHWCSQIWSKRGSTVPSLVPTSSVEVTDDPCPPRTNYEVFISFRGEDTRKNFTSHFYDALCKKKIKTFKDNMELKTGEEISSTLLKIIEGSKIFVIVFSKNYASSTWCLDELIKILECRESYGRLVIPIFYEVDASDVRKLTGSYSNSFVRHKQRFNMEKVDKWKAALEEASNLSGYDSTKISTEAELVETIVEVISEELKRNSSYDLDGLVGIQRHISTVESFLNNKSQEVRIIGIWGTKKIGKTQIAKAIFYKLKAQFESCSFVMGGQKKLEEIRGKCLQDLVEETDSNLHSFRLKYVKDVLRQKKILLIIDDVRKSTQIEDFFEGSECFGRDCFGPGSRIIIITRDKELLKTANADEIYHVKGSFEESLQLFFKKSFKQNLPIKDWVENSRREMEKVSEETMEYLRKIPQGFEDFGNDLKKWIS